MSDQINMGESVFVELMSPRFKQLLKDLLIKYAQPNEPANEQLRKVLKGFEQETVAKVRDIHQQVSVQIDLCEIYIFQVERHKIKALLDLEELSDTSPPQERAILETNFRSYREAHDRLYIQKIQLNKALKKAHEFLVNLRVIDQ